jgi:hypothetical protein
MQVEDASGFRQMGEELTTQHPAHVFLDTVDPAVLSELRRLWLARKIYGAYVTDPTFDVQIFADELDALPVFEVTDAASALAIAKELVRDPYRVAEKAINGAAVVERYGEGRPT